MVEGPDTLLVVQISLSGRRNRRQSSLAGISRPSRWGTCSIGRALGVAGGGAGNAIPFSGFQLKLAGPGTLLAHPLKRPPDLRSRRPGQDQVLPRLVPDPATVLNRPVGAFEQIVHYAQSTTERIVPINRAGRAHLIGGTFLQISAVSTDPDVTPALAAGVSDMVVHIGAGGIIEVRQAIARRTP